MPLPLDYDIEVYKGDTWGFQFALCEDGTSTPKDVSGSIIQMQVRETPDSGATLLELSSEDDQITFGEDNYITILATATEMDIAPGKWFFDIQQVDGLTVQTKISGRFTVRAEVTR